MHKHEELLEIFKNELISLAKIKKYLSISHDHDDELLQDMLEIALISAENYIGQILRRTSWKMVINSELPRLVQLSCGPILGIEQFKIFKLNNEEVHLNEEHYIIDEYNWRIMIKRQYLVKKAEIIYQLGYKKLPAPIVQGVLEHIAKLYDLRGGDQSIPIAAKSLYQPYKRLRL